jgi:hypothetical protein
MKLSPQAKFLLAVGIPITLSTFACAPVNPDFIMKTKTATPPPTEPASIYAGIDRGKVIETQEAKQGRVRTQTKTPTTTSTPTVTHTMTLKPVPTVEAMETPTLGTDPKSEYTFNPYGRIIQNNFGEHLNVTTDLTAVRNLFGELGGIAFDADMNDGYVTTDPETGKAIIVYPTGEGAVQMVGNLMCDNTDSPEGVGIVLKNVIDQITQKKIIEMTYGEETRRLSQGQVFWDANAFGDLATCTSLSITFDSKN